MKAGVINPLDMWINEGGALAREAGSGFARLQPMGFGGPSRWICRFSPSSFRRSYSKRTSQHRRRNRCILRYG
jgi:hypothetical protein